MNCTVRYTTALAVFALVLGLNFAVQAQSFWPKNLGSTINTPLPEVNPVLTPGGDTLFFSRLNSKGNRYGAGDSQDIWMSIKDESGAWQQATRLPNTVNIARYNALYGVLAGGKKFLIANAYDKPGKHFLRRGFSFITLDSAGNFSAPQRVTVRWFSWMDEGEFTNATITPDGKYIFMAFSRRWWGRNLHIYVSHRIEENLYSRPVRIKGPLKEFKSLEAPYFDTCTQQLYFAAKTSNDPKADCNIYAMQPVSGKNMQEWQNLRRLSDTVNSTAWDSYFYPAGVGTYAMMCSNNEGTIGASDIFRVMLVEERPWVKVTGKVFDRLTDQPVDMRKNPKVLVNGEVSDSVTMDGESPEFFALLPLGQKYTFTATAPHYVSDTVVVDMEDVKLYTEQEVSLTLTSDPYVTVRGNILNSLALSPISKTQNPSILIDGKESADVKLDPSQPRYEVNLPFGRKYQITGRATGYDPVTTELDLTAYREWAEVDFDAKAKPQNANMVTLTGKVINTKTGSPLEPGIPVRMRVNKVFSDNFKYNDKTAEYTLMLPAGADYDLVPSAQNFYNKLEVVNLTNAKPRTTVQRNFFVTPLEVGQSVDIENIFFETGKSKLKPESYRSLNALVDFFNEYPNVKVEVGGHTDNVGSAALNKRLSQARAQSVADYIIEQGIGKERFQAKGWGMDKPKASNKTKKGRAQNRRVDFTIMGI